MTRLLRRFRQLRCDHRLHTTGRDCPDDDSGFQVQCIWCGKREWLCCDCWADCEVS